MLSRPRYRIRTWLREHAPEPVAGLFPPGSRDCGGHDWFRLDEGTDVCRHCLVGQRAHVPIPLKVGDPEWCGLVDGIAHGSRASAEVMAERLREAGVHRAGRRS